MSKQYSRRAISKRFVSKNKKKEETSFNLIEITKYLRESWAAETSLHGGAPPKKTTPTVPSIDEQISCLQEKLTNLKTVSRSDILMKASLVQQINKLQEKKKQEGASPLLEPIRNKFCHRRSLQYSRLRNCLIQHSEGPNKYVSSFSF